jgi:hypothetical protein
MGEYQVGQFLKFIKYVIDNQWRKKKKDSSPNIYG